MSWITRRHFLEALAVVYGGMAHASDGVARFIVPYPPGGVVDVIAREFQAPLQAALSRTVIIENIPGAAGAIGLKKMLAAPLSDETFALGTDSDVLLVPMANPALKFAPNDFRLIGLLGSSTLVLVTGSSLAGEPLASLVHSRRRPGAAPLTCGNVGVDSNMHLIAEALARRTQLELIHVPYKGIAPLVQDLMGGHLDMAFLPFAGSIPATLESGKLRAIGVANATGIAQLPLVPTIASATSIGSFNFESWSGIFVSRTLQTASAQWLNAAMQKAVAAPAFRQAIAAAGVNVASPMDLAESARFFSAAQASARQLVAGRRTTSLTMGALTP